MEAFRAPRQSTLLLDQGEKQFWYSPGEARPGVIAAELSEAIVLLFSIEFYTMSLDFSHSRWHCWRA